MKRMLITGAAGHVGRTMLRQPEIEHFDVLACDLAPIDNLPVRCTFETMDVRDSEGVNRIVEDFKPDVVVHLASVVTPPKGLGREFAFDVDVTGTQNIIDACLAAHVDRLVVTSSGAAYGYHPENAMPLTESSPIRGNYEFPYSHHKSLVEEMLEQLRDEHPKLQQVVLRVGTVLGDGIENQITALFHKPRLLGIRGNESPFVFIWADDLAQILLHACGKGKPGIYNVAADGALGVAEIAGALGKPTIRFPVWLLKMALAIASPLRLSQYGPEQVRFLQYRPVLDNTRLKSEFAYTPQKTSLEAFRAWQKQAGL